VSDELTRYLSTDPERVKDALEWWNDRRASFPNLSRMALDYLSIPATSVDPERTFSRGRLALPHTRNRLSPQSTRALMCVGNWSLAGFIHQSD
ncbi:HAT dimerization, partial [Trametes versicolor FP-101664 SS1]|uniref:HAT dimerization n=1 Tax=Trametes versicolor (strain FP-101664) TaxID=717944 RepID=UPI0004624099